MKKDDNLLLLLLFLLLFALGMLVAMRHMEHRRVTDKVVDCDEDDAACNDSPTFPAFFF